MEKNANIRHDTAAGRAFILLRKAMQQPPNQNVRQTWAATFGISANDDTEIRYRLSLLLGQLGTAQREFYRAEATDFQDPFPILLATVASMNLDETWAARAKVFSGNLTALALASYICASDLKKQVVETEKISEWRTEVDGLISEILESGVPQELKETLSGHLNAVRDALLYYQIRGTDGLQDAVLASWGALFLNAPQVKAAAGRADPKKKTPIQRMLDLLRQISQSIKVVRELQKIAPEAMAVLLEAASGG